MQDRISLISGWHVSTAQGRITGKPSVTSVREEWPTIRDEHCIHRASDEINSPMESSRIALPSLSPRYELALRAASEYVFSEFDPFAVVVSGSIVRGNPDPACDFDIIVIHRHSAGGGSRSGSRVSQLKSSRIRLSG
jgi:hypothetical protein